MMTYRIQTPLQKIVTTVVLVLFLATVFFSFASMMHESEAGMRVDCPFSIMGEPLCPQNVAAAIMHHISAYQSFLAVFAQSGITAGIITLLLALCAVLLLSVGPLIYRPPAQHVRYLFETSLTTPLHREVIRWLSLLENSPAAI